MIELKPKKIFKTIWDIARMYGITSNTACKVLARNDLTIGVNASNKAVYEKYAFKIKGRAFHMWDVEKITKILDEHFTKLSNETEMWANYICNNIKEYEIKLSEYRSNNMKRIITEMQKYAPEQLHQDIMDMVNNYAGKTIMCYLEDDTYSDDVVEQPYGL